MDPQFCPADPDLVSFVRDSAIWVTRVSTRMATELVPNPGSGISVGVPSYIIQDEFGRHSGYWWKEASDADGNGGNNGGGGGETHGILYDEVDETAIDLTPVVNFTKPGSVDNFACPLVGSNNARVSLKLVEFPASIGTAAVPPPGPDSADAADASGAGRPVVKGLRTAIDEWFPWCEYVVRCGWLPDRAMCWVQLLDRDQVGGGGGAVWGGVACGCGGVWRGGVVAWCG